MHKLCRGLCNVVAIASVLFGSVVWGQSYPDHAVRLIVPFAPGGATDVLGRVLAAKLEELLKQPFVVVNLGGAGGTIGTDTASKAAPDGYTFLVMSSLGFTVQKKLYPDLKFDPLTSFTPIGSFGVTQYVLVVNPDLPAKDIDAFIKLVRSDPRKYNISSAGVGSATNLAAELFQRAANIELVHVPFQGSAPSLNAVMGGHVSAAFDDAAAIPFVNSGKLRALAVTGKQRVSGLPNVPTLAESGLAGFDVSSLFGLVAPAGVSDVVVTTINNAIAQAIKDPAVRERILALGIDPQTRSAQEFAAALKSESEKWTRLVDEAKIKL